MSRERLTMKINKYVLCRFSVSIICVVALVAAILSADTIISMMQQFGILDPAMSFGIGALWLIMMLIVVVILALPIIGINWIWYIYSVGKDHDTDIMAFFIAIAALIEMMFSFMTLFTPPGSAGADVAKLSPYTWVPGAIILINVIFIVIYSTIGKKTCKIIYRGGN